MGWKQVAQGEEVGWGVTGLLGLWKCVEKWPGAWEGRQNFRSAQCRHDLCSMELVNGDRQECLSYKVLVDRVATPAMMHGLNMRPKSRAT